MNLSHLVHAPSLLIEAVVVVICLELGFPFILYAVYSLSMFATLYAVFLPLLVEGFLTR